MNYYFLFLRNETIDFSAYSPEEMQKIMSDFDAWNEKMIAAGQLLASASLQGGGGKTIRPGSLIADGPYSETKEAVAGVLLLFTETEAQATEIALGCPFLPRGGSVELRPALQVEFEDVLHPLVNAHIQARIEKGEPNI